MSSHHRILSLVFTLSLALPSVASADQVVVAEVRYEHGADTTTDSHYRIEPLPAAPADLTSPVDYASGTAVVRLEVFTKPSDEPTRFQVCFEARPTYACTNQAPPYTETGVYTWTTPFSDFYQGALVDWSMGLGRIALILKDTMNGKPAPENVGEEVSSLYMPTELRVTVTLVSAGDTYVPPEEMTPDAGMPLDAGTELDAGARPDAGRTTDAGTRDAGETNDASSGDAGGGDAGSSGDGGCAVASGALPSFIGPLLLFALFPRRRR